MNKRGNIGLEALISVTVFILFCTFLTGMIHFLGLYDSMSQNVLKEIERVSQYNYGYESIGLMSLEDIKDLELVKSIWPTELDFLLEEEFGVYEKNQKSLILKTILSSSLKKLEKHSRIEEVKVEVFELEDEILSTLVTYDQILPLGFRINQSIASSHQLWYLGNNKSLIDLETLAEFLGKKKKNLKAVWFMSQKQGADIILKAVFI